MPQKTLNSLLRVVVEQGLPVEQVVRQIGLDFNPLSDPDKVGEIPSAAYSKLYRLLMELQQDEAFGLGREYHAPPGTFRMMCLFIIHCPTLKQALIRSREFHDYCDQYRRGAPQSTPGTRAILPLPDSDNVLCSFDRREYSGRDKEFVGHANVLLMMYRFYSWLIGKELPLQGVMLRAAAPGNPAHYEQLFQCSVHFEQPHSGLVIHKNLLQHPVAQNEDSLREFLRQAPYLLVRRSQPGSVNELSRQIEQILSRYATAKMPTAEQMAGHLNMSPRTLHRKLTQEGTSFQQLKDSYRKELAVHYVSRAELTIEAIAALMGFQDNSAFYRSFKKWTGVSPGQFRQQLQEESREQV